MNSLRELLMGLARVSSPTGKTATKDVRTVLKKVETGIDSVNRLFRNAAVTRSKSGAILISNTPANRILGYLRKGDLAGLLRALKSTTVVTAEQAGAFRKIVSDFPEVKLAQLDDYARKVKAALPDLDVTVDQMDKLPKSARSRLASVTQKLYNHFPKGTKVFLLIGAFVMGANWLQQATKSRRGCFMLKKIGGKITSCRVDHFSCSLIGPRDGLSGPTTCPPRSYKKFYNTTLVLMAACRSQESNHCSQSIAAALKMADIVGKFEEIYNDDNKYLLAARAIEQLAKNDELPNFRICDVTHPSLEQGTVLPCRLCDPYADPKTTAYIDPSQFSGSDITFRCNADPSIVETIADVMSTTGVNLLDTVGSSMYTILKPLALVGLFILCILIIIGITVSFFKRKFENLLSLQTEDKHTLV